MMNEKLKDKADEILSRSRDKSYPLWKRILYVLLGLLMGGTSVYVGSGLYDGKDEVPVQEGEVSPTESGPSVFEER